MTWSNCIVAESALVWRRRWHSQLKLWRSLQCWQWQRTQRGRREFCQYFFIRYISLIYNFFFFLFSLTKITEESYIIVVLFYISGVYGLPGNVRRLPPQVSPHGAKPSGVQNSNYRAYPSSKPVARQQSKNSGHKVPESHKNLPGGSNPYGGFKDVQYSGGLGPPPPRPSRHSSVQSNNYGYPGNQGRLLTNKEHNKSKPVPNIDNRWDQDDGGSSTSGSYILDLKDLGDTVDQTSYNAVVV